jgi:hypothetical protein
LNGVNGNGAWSDAAKTYLTSNGDLSINNTDPIGPVQTWLNFDNGQYITGTISYRKDFDGDGIADLQSMNFDTSRIFTEAATGVNGGFSWDTSAVGYTAAVPEPTALSLILGAGVGLLALRRLFTPDYRK